MPLATPAAVGGAPCRDHDGTAVLGTAHAAQADCIVCGEQDLLVLGSFFGIRILKPRDLGYRLSSG